MSNLNLSDANLLSKILQKVRTRFFFLLLSYLRAKDSIHEDLNDFCSYFASKLGTNRGILPSSFNLALLS